MISHNAKAIVAAESGDVDIGHENTRIFVDVMRGAEEVTRFPLSTSELDSLDSCVCLLNEGRVTQGAIESVAMLLCKVL